METIGKLLLFTSVGSDHRGSQLTRDHAQSQEAGGAGGHWSVEHEPILTRLVVLSIVTLCLGCIDQ